MKLKHIIKRENGQSMVEFALVLPILLLFIGGIIDFGWIFHNQILANNATREAARFVAIQYYYPTGEIKGDINKADLKATSIITGSLPKFTGVDVTVTKTPDDIVTGEKIKIVFKGDIKILTPILSTIIDKDNNGKFPVTSESTMRIEK